MGDLHLPDDRYLAALERQRRRIAEGLPYTSYDCDDVGDKETHASWGLCSNERAAWPDRDDHLWPERFDEGRVAPKYRRGELQRCPMDLREKGTGVGCFYSCRIFQKRQNIKASRDRALALYDQQIERTKAALRKARGEP